MKFMCKVIFASIFMFYSTVIFSDIPKEYKLGIDDTVRISVFQQPDLALVSRIDASGSITFPLIGEVRLAGLTTLQAEKTISDSLKKGGYLKNPQVSIQVEAYKSAQVSVLGNVSKPGKYPIERTISVIDMLAIAGGLTPDGGDVLLVVRGVGRQAKRIEVDLLRFAQGDLSQNIELVGGDLILVPRMEEFYIYGEVRSPGIYRLRRNMTVMQGLSVGGGLSDKASRKGVVISRQSKNGAVEEKKSSLEDRIKVNDVVYVKESIF